MPDILDAAATQSLTGSNPVNPPDGSDTVGSSPLSTPISPISPITPTSDPLDSLVVKSAPSPDPDKELKPPDPPPPISPLSPISPISPISPPSKKGPGKGVLLSIILFLLLTVPLSVKFIASQRQLAEIRGRAREADCRDRGEECGENEICKSEGGSYICVPKTTPAPTIPPGVCVPTYQDTCICSDGSSGEYNNCSNTCENCASPPPSPPPIVTTTAPPPPRGNYCDRSASNTSDCTDKPSGWSPCYTRDGRSGSCRVLDPGGANAECDCYVPPAPPGGAQKCPNGTQGQSGQPCDILNRCDIGGGCNPACGAKDEIRGSQICDVPNGYCRTGYSCRPKTTGTPPPGGTPPPTPPPQCQPDSYVGCANESECCSRICTDNGTGSKTCRAKESPPAAPQCLRIKIYKDNQVTTPSTLQAGNAVKIAVVGGSAAKVRVRINGGVWNETTTKNTGGEFMVDWTVPANTTNFSIEAETFVNGTWR